MLDLGQILAIVIFILMFAAIISGKIHRYIPALVGGGLVLVVVFLIVLREPESVIRVINIGQIGTMHFWIGGHETAESHGINWQTIIFIAGMMIMVEGMAHAGFFNWLCLFLKTPNGAV